MVGIKNRLAEFRKQANLSQEEFADKVGVRRETIIRVEGGKYYPSLLVAHDIATALDKTIDEIFFPVEETDVQPINEIIFTPEPVNISQYTPEKLKYHTQAT